MILVNEGLGGFVESEFIEGVGSMEVIYIERIVEIKIRGKDIVTGVGAWISGLRIEDIFTVMG